MSTRTNNTILNAITSLLLTFVNGILGLIVTRMIIFKYGSDFNGLNSTANQIVSILLILEGGFTIASNVALFRPISEKNYNKINFLLGATRKKFEDISLIFLITGFVVTIIYCFIIKSNLDYKLIFTVIFLAIIPASFNLYFTSTSRVVLLSFQKEYIINIFTAFTITLSHIFNIVWIFFDGTIWMIRFIISFFAILNCILIRKYVIKNYRFINFKLKNSGRIDGTYDVMIQKITGVIYSSSPIVFLSIFSVEGTMLASVYAVYSSVFIMVKSVLQGIIAAPRLSFGQMIVQKNYNKIAPIFLQYELIVFILIFSLLTTTFVLILPFISLFTSGVTDISYCNSKIAIILTLITVTEMIHIPSGHIINMAGLFKISKNFQLIACLILLIFMIIGCLFWDIYGLLSGVLLSALLLAFLEMQFIHKKIFEIRLYKLIKMIFPFIVSGILVCIFEVNYFDNIFSLSKFIYFGIVIVLINTFIGIGMGCIFNKSELTEIVKSILRIFRNGKLYIVK